MVCDVLLKYSVGSHGLDVFPDCLEEKKKNPDLGKATGHNLSDSG